MKVSAACKTVQRAVEWVLGRKRKQMGELVELEIYIVRRKSEAVRGSEAPLPVAAVIDTRCI